jgi:metal-sulfur cluster biosynthetic enzyme
MENENIKKNIKEKLKEVHDPEIPVNIVDLGLIYEVKMDEQKLNIEMTLTSMGCPTADAIKNEVENKSKKVDGVEEVEVEIVYDPPWKLEEHASEEAKTRLRAMGIKIPDY